MIFSFVESDTLRKHSIERLHVIIAQKLPDRDLFDDIFSKSLVLLHFALRKTIQVLPSASFKC